MRILKWAPGGQLFFPEKNVMVFSSTPYSANLVVNLWSGKTKPILPSSPLLKMMAEAPKNAFIKVALSEISQLTKFVPKTMVLGNTSAAFFMAMEAKENLFLMLKLVTESEMKAKSLQQVIDGLRALVTSSPARMSIRTSG